MPPSSETSNRPVIIWLLTGCVLIAAMVMIGGITRLTHSGLSMVDWAPIMGSIPPTTEQEWQETFNRYKQFPEYQQVNTDMSLEGFKSIFFWEYLHRMWGRMMGLVFIIPFAIFWKQGRLRGELMKKTLLILLGGALVGGIGWFMVLSGLKDRPDVSHYRLAIHLVAAFSLFAYVLWTALDLIRGEKTGPGNAQRPLLRQARWLVALVLVQVAWGAFVAGTNAGFIFNTFPKMGSAWVPEAVFSLEPLWLNFVEGKAGIQFVHRILAYLIVLLVGWIIWGSVRIRITSFQRRALNWILVMVVVQFILGVLTLTQAVPLTLGVLHQLGALLLLAATVNLLHGLQYAPEEATLSSVSGNRPKNN